MSTRNIWVWLMAAVCLFAFIFIYQRHPHKAPVQLANILPDLNPAEVTSIQLRPGPAQLEIRAERTNNVWSLTEPAAYSAESVKLDELLQALARLTPATIISENELRQHADADKEFGLTSPQASLRITQQNGPTLLLLIGATTSPGDQVYFQRVGVQGIFLVDADLLRNIPRSVNDWRNTSLISFDSRSFDLISVTNGTKSVVLEQDSSNTVWRIVLPRPAARADAVKIFTCLTNLLGLHIRQFVSDNPKQDLDIYGLLAPELELGLASGTNTIELLQFGKSPTNDASVVFARRAGRPSVFTVPKEPLAPWRAPINDFRDSHLVSLNSPLENVDVEGADSFTLQSSSNQWTILPSIPADIILVNEFLSSLRDLKVVQFVNDNVTELGWAAYGLTTPVRRYVLRNRPANVVETNTVLVDLRFGVVTNQPDRVFVRRMDENSVYAITTNDFALLPASSWQLRDRRIWHVEIEDVTGVSICQQGKTRQILRHGLHSWSLARGSQGIINDLAVEETVRGIIAVSARAWSGCGEQERARFGFAADPFEITVELQQGPPLKIEFGGEATENSRYAAVTLDGKLRIFEFPWLLYRDVATYLSVQ